MARTVVGLFDDYSEAQSAVRDLESAGFGSHDVSIVANESAKTMTSDTADRTTGDTADNAAAGAGTGATIGAVGGGTLGLLASLGLFAIPGFGPILAAGPIVATLTGAGIGAAAGAATGGLIGALTTAGVPEEDAAFYSEGVRRGGTLVTVTCDANCDRAVDILNRHDVVNIDERGQSYRQEGFTRYDSNAKPFTTDQIRRERERYRQPAVASSATMNREGTASSMPNEARNNQTIPVVEENLQVGKREVDRGGVRVKSYVTEQPVREQVKLREEQVNVERHAVDRPATESDFNRAREGVYEVRETAEVPVVQKQARVVEEVAINKEVHDRTETVEDTVRRTDVQVENLGGKTGSRRFEDFDSDFRKDFQTNYASSGGSYEQYAPAYRYGYDIANDQRYRGRDWNAIQSDLQRDWEARQPGTWNRYSNSVRYAWDRARTGAANMEANAERAVGGNAIPGIQTGGRTEGGGQDTRGLFEKAEDAITGDKYDDKTGRRVA